MWGLFKAGCIPNFSALKRADSDVESAEWAQGSSQKEINKRSFLSDQRAYGSATEVTGMHKSHGCAPYRRWKHTGRKKHFVCCRRKTFFTQSARIFCLLKKTLQETQDILEFGCCHDLILKEKPAKLEVFLLDWHEFSKHGKGLQNPRSSEGEWFQDLASDQPKKNPSKAVACSVKLQTES